MGAAGFCHAENIQQHLYSTKSLCYSLHLQYLVVSTVTGSFYIIMYLLSCLLCAIVVDTVRDIADDIADAVIHALACICCCCC